MPAISDLLDLYCKPKHSRLVPRNVSVVRSFFDEEQQCDVIEVRCASDYVFTLNAEDWSLVSSHPICRTGHGYAIMSRLRKCIHTGGWVHRVIMLGMTGGVDALWRDGERLSVDHINGNITDNRRCNLRICDHHGNMRNQSKVSGSSRFKGVYASSTKGKWQAAVRVTENKKARNVYLGTFAVEEDAARAYDARVKELFGEFAKTNADLGLYEQA